MHPLPLSFCAHVRLNKKYWSEPRKHDRKIRHRAATANKLVDIVVVAAVVTAIALAAAVSFLSL